MLPAAAVAMASSLPDLIIIGAEVARVAFRIGIHVHRTSRLLDARPDGTNCVSWVYAVTSLSLDEVEKEISMFNRTAVRILQKRGFPVFARNVHSLFYAAERRHHAPLHQCSGSVVRHRDGSSFTTEASILHFSKTPLREMDCLAGVRRACSRTTSIQ